MYHLSALLSLLVVLILLSSGPIAYAKAAPQEGEFPLAIGSPIPISLPLAPPSAGPPLRPIDTSEPIEFSISLEGRNAASLQERIDQENEPASPYFHDFLTQTGYESQFGPDPAGVAKMLTYLQLHGLTTNRIGNLLLVKGTAGEVETALSITLMLYHDGNGTAWAPSRAPTLPSSLASLVSSTLGLNTFIRPRPDIVFPGGPPEAAPSAPSHTAPHPLATLSVALTAPTFSYPSQGGQIYTPPSGINVTFTATATLPTGDTCAPCTFYWKFGDGTHQIDLYDANVDAVGHAYKEAFDQFTNPIQLTVTVTDAQGATGSSGNAVIPTLSPSWMQSAYDEQTLLLRGETGQGMTIGLDEMCDPNFDSGTANYDGALSTFSSALGLPPASTNYIGPGTSCPSGSGYPGWGMETILDMEWAHAIAPNTTLQVYFGGASDASDVAGGDATWASASAGVFLASNSWGISEKDAGNPGPFDSTWGQAASEGITIFSASGDCGGTLGTANLAVNYPASEPDGVGVGGTVVRTNHSGDWVGEYAWNGTAYSGGGNCANNWGTGGGWSQYYSTPSYQQGMGGPGWIVPSNWPIPNPRGIPDVAMDAATWVDIYYPGDSTGVAAGWYRTGGTSLASPMWAAMMAVVLEAMNRNYNVAPAGFLNLPIYIIGKSAAYSIAFHDITQGDNKDPLGYSATSDWDPTTGWGTPIATGILSALSYAIPILFSISGSVYDAGTNAPISGATVTASSAYGVPGSPAISTATTTSSGSYTLTLPNGSYTLNASASGYNSNSIAVVVTGNNLVNQNILLYPLTQGSCGTVSGFLRSETRVPLVGGQVMATGGATQASVSTGEGGAFQLCLLPGTYTLTGSYITPIPTEEPGLNATSITLTLNGPVEGVVITLPYSRNTFTGQVFSLANQPPKPLSRVTVDGFNMVSGVVTTDSQGRFHLHLPTGPATLTASASNYFNVSVAVFVLLNGTGTVTIYLDPTHVAPRQVVLSLRLIAPINGTSKLPEIRGESSVNLDVWANNSTTGAPQIGLGIFLSDTAGGSFAHASTKIPSTGMAVGRFYAPYLALTTLDKIVASVRTPGWVGSTATYLWILTNAPSCGKSCRYPVHGFVFTNKGSPIPGATVAILNTLGAMVARTTTESNGAFYLFEGNGSYVAVAMARGYVGTASQHFQVAGSKVSLGPLTLTPYRNLTIGKLVSSRYAYVVPILVGISAVIVALLFLVRLFRRPEEKEEPAISSSVPPSPPIDAESTPVPPPMLQLPLPPAAVPPVGTPPENPATENPPTA